MRDAPFYEFVRRRDAHGFGGANIKAVYEAVGHSERAAG